MGHMHVWLAAVALVAVTCVASGQQFSLPGDAAWPSEDEVAALADELAHGVQENADIDYPTLTRTYNLRVGRPRPAFVVQPTSEAEVSRALAFARRHTLRVAVSATGHHQDVRNVADNALLLHLGRMQTRVYNAEARTITVGPGQTWGAVHAWLHGASNGAHVAASGADATVGPAGWTLGGGHGRLTRLYGLGVDVVRSMRVVLPNGDAVTADATGEYADLFWALRGGGGAAFGVVTEFTFDVFAEPGGFYEWTGLYPATHQTADRFEAFMRSASNHVGGYFLPSSSYAGYVLFAMYCVGTPAECGGAGVFAALADGCLTAESPDLCKHRHTSTSYGEWAAQQQAGDVGRTGSLMFASTSLDFAEGTHALRDVVDWVGTAASPEWQGAAIGCSGNAVLGGASTDMDANRNATSVAPAMRKAIMAITCYWAFPGTDHAKAAALTSKLYEWGEDVLLPAGVDHWSYWNEPAHVFPSTAAWQERYWGGAETYAQLRAVKRKYDPDNVLTCYHCVGWEDVENVDPAYCSASCTACTNVLAADECAVSPNTDPNPATHTTAAVATTLALLALVLTLV